MRCWQHKSTVRALAPAKLNLFLEIHARRPDGFHELETLMVRAGICDTLCFEEEDSDTSHLRIRNAETRTPGGNAPPDLSAGEDNLILRAVRAVQSHAGVDRQVRITLEKRIPVASGMAGGSSDAAATLVGLNRLWDLGLGRDELFELGASLGSDVNFFLCGAFAAVCRGRGELIEPLPVPADLSFVVVRPHSGLSTAEVFRHCRPSANARPVGPLVDALRRGHPRAIASRMFNALQSPAEGLNSEVRALRNRFESLPTAGHLMTGSGTAYFGLCPNRRTAKQLAARLSAEGLGRVFSV